MIRDLDHPARELGCAWADGVRVAPSTPALLAELAAARIGATVRPFRLLSRPRELHHRDFCACRTASGSVRLGRGSAHREGPITRLPALFALALAMFFLLPFDTRGYSYNLNTRYAHLAAALLVCMVPPLVLTRVRHDGACCARVRVHHAAAAARLLRVRSRGAGARAPRGAQRRQAARIGLLYGAGSPAVRYPVHLHAACALARAKGGITNFSFATTPHSPLMYRGEAPPTFPSEWRPLELRWATQGSYCDHFLVRGREPKQVFGRLLGSELEEVGYADGFYLVRKKR